MSHFRPLHAFLFCVALPALGLAQTREASPSSEPATSAQPRDQVIAKLATRARPDQQYSLYLPADYSPQQPAPLLIILDARGRCQDTAGMAVEGARANGWIVMSSCQSRSDGLESVTLNALQALLDEAAQRYRPDGRRIYLAGFSGTAKTLWTQVEALRKPLAGMIGNSGGRPPELGPMRLTPPAFFGMAGTRDFNYQEMRDLDQDLAEAQAVRRLAIFEGRHGWPADPAIFTAAIDWLELMSMRDGRAPRREAWIDSQLTAARMAITQATDPLERWRLTEQLVRDFTGLRDVSAEQAQATRLAESSEVRAALKTERNLRSSERQHGQRFDAWRIRAASSHDSLGQRQDPPSVTRTLAELRIRPLQKLAGGSDQARADSAARVLERDFVATAFYLPEQLVAQGDVPRAVAMLEIASAIFPDRPRPYWRRAQLLASENRIDDAFQALAASKSLGYVDGDDLRDNPVWQPLHDDPRWAAMTADTPAREGRAPQTD